ncbi:VAN3-binding protein-like [Iris pallida]|uniref:VAN3-binding protein-like n=1 Tax=Iris pallida TaxID=29817 RepID=A0AAX6E9N1_IRIPA|nr:VAN3-binding protein-like [Iris pallida]
MMEEAAGDVEAGSPFCDPMEFLSRSWSVSALEVSRALSSAPAMGGGDVAETIPEEPDEEAAAVAGSNFSFASSATSQLVLERIMSQSQEVSPLTSGRLSHSSGPLNGGSLSDSPPLSPSDLEDVKYCRAISAAKPRPVGTNRTVGRWLKDRRERKKEETRAHNAQLHAAVSVAGVAAAVAAVAAATAASAASGGSRKDDRAARTDMAVASAATLVAAQCVEAAEAMGAEREHLASVVGVGSQCEDAGGYCYSDRGRGYSIERCGDTEGEGVEGGVECGCSYTGGERGRSWGKS